MAKLNGVTTVNMQDGKVTGISYNGAEYVGIAEKAKAGDIIYVTGTSEYSDTLADVYYGVINDPSDGGITYIDETGDECYVGGPESNTFRKLDAKPTTEKRHAIVGERILIMDNRASYEQTYKLNDVLTVTKTNAFSKGDVKVEGQPSFVDYTEYEVIVEPTKSKLPADLIAHKGDDYSLVQRKAQAGDVVVFTENTSVTTSINVPHGPVTKSDGELFFKSGHAVYRKRYNRTESNVLVYEKVAVEAPKRFPQYGDIVRVTSDHYNKGFTEGAIGVVVDADSTFSPEIKVCGKRGYARVEIVAEVESRADMR